MSTILRRVKVSRFWPLIKHALPRYHRPLLRLGLAKAMSLVGRDDRELALAYAGLAKLRIYEDALPQALALCERAIARDRSCAQAHALRGDALLSQGRARDAIDSLRAGLCRLEDADGRAVVNVSLANAFLAQDNPLEALKSYESARAIQPAIPWPAGAALVSPDPLEAARRFMTYYPSQPTPARTMALLNRASDLFEAALRSGADVRSADEMLFCFYLAGRGSSFNKALALRFSAFTQGSPSPRVEFLPDFCARGIGPMGWLTTFVKKKILLGTAERLTLCAPPPQVVNPAFLSYFKPFIEVLETPESIESAAESKAASQRPLELGLPFDGAPKYLITIMAEVANRWAEENRAPLLRLRDDHRERGRAALSRLGLRPDDWWVCLHVRTPTYKSEGPRSADTFRNADIKTYLDAVKTITDRGGHVFRMGDPSMTPLPPMERVIDYARSELRSDWMDVFLCASCRFYIGTNSGLLLVPNAFGVPSIATNILPLLVAPFLPDDVFLPMLLRKKSGELMPFREMLQEPFAFGVIQDIYDGSEVEVVPNTADELRGTVSEMLGSFDPSGRRKVPPTTELQRKFAGLVEEAGATISGRISADFLSRRRGLL